jgi:hypothetical protein
MARVIGFFGKTVITNNAPAIPTGLVSPVFEVSEFSTLVAALQLFSTNGAFSLDITATIQETSDATLDPTGWSGLQVLTANPTSQTGKAAISNPQRFVRAVVSLPSGNFNACISLQAVGRESS